MKKLYRPDLYPFRVAFTRHFTDRKLDYLDGPDTLAFGSVVSAQRWIDGIRANCKEWSFACSPLIEPNV